MQYYGEWRSFRIVRIQALDGEMESSTSPTKRSGLDKDRDIVSKLSELVIDGSFVNQQHISESMETTDLADSGLSEEVSVFKVTSRSRIKVVKQSVDKEIPQSKVMSTIGHDLFSCYLRVKPDLWCLL